MNISDVRNGLRVVGIQVETFIFVLSVHDSTKYYHVHMFLILQCFPVVHW